MFGISPTDVIRRNFYLKFARDRRRCEWGPQEHFNITDKHLNFLSNKALKGHFGGQKHTFRRKVQTAYNSNVTTERGS